MPIQQVQILATILVEATTPQEAENRFRNMHLEEVAAVIDMGDAVGQVEIHGSVQTLSTDAARQRLLEMGSDETFFALKDEA